MKRSLRILVGSLLLTAFVLGRTQFEGSVTAVTATNFTVKGIDNKSTIFTTDRATTYSANGVKATRTALKVGVRVVIQAHLDAKLNTNIAEQVQIQVATPTPTPTPK